MLQVLASRFAEFRSKERSFEIDFEIDFQSTFFFLYRSNPAEGEIRRSIVETEAAEPIDLSIERC